MRNAVTCAVCLLMSGREREPRTDSGYYHEDSGEEERGDQLHRVFITHGCRRC